MLIMMPIVLCSTTPMITVKYIRVWIVVVVVSAIVVVDVVGGILVELYVTDVGEYVAGGLAVVSFDGVLVVVSANNDVVFPNSVNRLVVIS